jgi:hypothetical protein
MKEILSPMQGAGYYKKAARLSLHGAGGMPPPEPTDSSLPAPTSATLQRTMVRCNVAHALAVLLP